MTLFGLIEVLEARTEIEVERFNKTTLNTTIYVGTRNRLFAELRTYGSSWYKLGGKKVVSVRPTWSKDGSGIRITIEGRKTKGE